MAYRTAKRYMTPRITGVKKKSRFTNMKMVPYKGKKYSSRKMQIFHQQPKAARYGFFMDMLKKYAAVKAFGAGKSTADKMIQRIKGNKRKRESASQMKIKGFRVARFVLASIPIGIESATLGNAGYVNTLTTQFIPFPTVFQSYQTTTNMDAGREWPGLVTAMDTYVIHPQWPGSKLATWLNQGQAAGFAVQPRFGLLRGNSLQKDDNFKYNSRATQEVYPFGSINRLSEDRLDILFRSINVYKSKLEFQFWNTSWFVEMDVHIVHFKLRAKDYSNSINVCQTATHWNSLMDNIMTHGGDTSVAALNHARLNMDLAIMNKQLPTANYYTKSWKTIRLGKAIDPQCPTTTTDTTPPRYLGGSPAITKSPYKKVTFNYGPKTWRRSGCIEEGTLFPDDILDDNEMLDTQVMFFATPNKAYMNSNDVYRETSPLSLTATYKASQGVEFRINKTNLWREGN